MIRLNVKVVPFGATDVKMRKKKWMQYSVHSFYIRLIKLFSHIITFKIYKCDFKKHKDAQI